MAASFPNAKKTFSAVVNGVTKLVASLFNSPYEEVEAIETFIGATGGGAQSYYTSISDMLINYRRGCAVEYKGDADFYVRSGEIMITDASGNRRLRRNTSDTTVTWANIDTGSEATSTKYYVYACADNNATTFTVVISTNATTPSGMTYYRLIGSFYNNASGNIVFPSDIGVKGTFFGDAQVFNGTTPNIWADLDLSSIVGANACEVTLKVTSSNANQFVFRTKGDSFNISKNGYDLGASGIAFAAGTGGYVKVKTDSSGVVQWGSLLNEGGTGTVNVIAISK